jgi:hypothetical protein
MKSILERKLNEPEIARRKLIVDSVVRALSGCSQPCMRTIPVRVCLSRDKGFETASATARSCSRPRASDTGTSAASVF